MPDDPWVRVIKTYRPSVTTLGPHTDLPATCWDIVVPPIARVTKVLQALTLKVKVVSIARLPNIRTGSCPYVPKACPPLTWSGLPPSLEPLGKRM